MGRARPIRRDAAGAGQPARAPALADVVLRLAHHPPDALANLRTARARPPRGDVVRGHVVGDVEVGLVDPRGLEVRVEPLEDRFTLLRDERIARKAVPDEAQLRGREQRAGRGVRAEVLADEAGHGGAHAVLARDVVGCRNHREAPDRKGHVPDRRVDQRLHRGKEHVHVDMNVGPREISLLLKPRHH